MKQLFTFLVVAMMFAFISCEHPTDIGNQATNDNPSVIEIYIDYSYKRQ